jgi:hypothetical protein
VSSLLLIQALITALLAGTTVQALQPRAVVREQYVLNARIRPLLLFWIGRDNVGGATITWRTDDGRRAIELLIGTDPNRAPRQINRWGYVREEASDGEADVVGVMTASSEESLEQAESEVDRRRTSGGTLLKGVHTTFTSSEAVTTTASVEMAGRVTYRQVDEALGALRAHPTGTTRGERPSNVEPGFLFAMTTLIDRSLGPCRTTGDRHGEVAPVTYLYRQTIYDASLRSCSYAASFQTKLGAFPDVIDGRFDIRNRRTGEETKFRIVYGASGASSGRPVYIVFRPRWWMEAELVRAPVDLATRGSTGP